ncbi:hypothetical protein DK254_14160 [Pseudomonas sp. RW407]|nr:hypothetical protein DK254_14160 [Pseudomonas sp. RW407]
MSPLDLLTRRFIGRGIGRHGCMGPEGRPCNCVRQGMPGKFGAAIVRKAPGRHKPRGAFLDSPHPGT